MKSDGSWIKEQKELFLSGNITSNSLFSNNILFNEENNDNDNEFYFDDENNDDDDDFIEELEINNETNKNSSSFSTLNIMISKLGLLNKEDLQTLSTVFF